MKLLLLTLAAILAFALTNAHSAEPRQKKPPRDTPPATEKKEPRSLSGRALPYRVKVTAVDEPAATFSSAGKGGTVNVYAVTDKTTITKDSKPATFTDLVVGSIVTGTRTRTLDGKWEVASVNIQGVAATPRRSAKKDPAKPAENKPDEAKPAEKAEVSPAPADVPKVTEPVKPEEPKPDARPKEKIPDEEREESQIALMTHRLIATRPCAIGHILAGLPLACVPSPGQGPKAASIHE